RVKAVMRRVSPPPVTEPEVVEVGDLVLDGGSREVTLAGEVVAMPPLEFDLLMCLAAQPRRVFSRAELLELVWDSRSEWQDPSTVTVHVRRLRQRIEQDPDNPTRITTVWGRGYRFDG
ncbi:MAG: response regulator transcription factor, partial [Acidimicrobiia bacterium]|nr:response regulator transcription factor [Acidimicrobiia bacterium]